MGNQRHGITARIFVTKYALTQGLFSEECREVIADREKGETVTYWSGLGRFPGFYREGTDAFRTEEEARANVKKKAQARVKSMEKSLAKMREVVSTSHATMPIEHKPGKDVVEV